MSRVQWVRSLTRPSVTCDKAAPYLPRAVRSPQGVPAFLQHQGTSCCCSCWPKSSFGYFHKVVWEHANELFGQPKSLQLQQVKLLLFFFFFPILDTVWSSRQSHWLITVPWRIAPWPDGCSISERATQCAWIVSLQRWTLWAFVVLVMAWILTGKGERLVGGFLLALIWGDMSFSCHAQQTNIRFGESQQWGETSIWPFQSQGPSSHSRT